MSLAYWLGQRDRDFAALRRAGRTAIVMPALFALGDVVIGNPAFATFAAFGSFAMLLLVDFGGSIAARLQAELALGIVGGVLICLGTLASRSAWLAALAMAVVGFGVIFAGVISSVFAGATTALLLSFILPVSLAAPPSSIPDRLAGWAVACAVALAAIALAWPAPVRDPLRAAALTACRACASRLRSDVTFLLAGKDTALAADHDRAIAQARQAVAVLNRVFLATPYRPTGLSTAARTIIRLVDEIGWLDVIASQPAQHDGGVPVDRPACAVKLAAAGVLERGADLLEVTGGNTDELQAAMRQLTAAVDDIKATSATKLPVSRMRVEAMSSKADERVSEFLSSLEPTFRAQELTFAVTLIGRNIELATAAEKRSWPQRVLGRQPEGVPGTLSKAEERAVAFAEPHAVWLHNSLRGAVALGLAVLVARLSDVQHSFWVVLGTLSVLRSNALNTGQDIARALLGTIVGFVIGAAVLVGIGTNSIVLWILLPIAVFIAGVAPAAISFAAGQAAFTLTLVILFNILQPAGWKVGLLRLEDIGLGCGVSLVVGLLFWPRGAGAALRQAVAEAYADSAAYLAAAVDFGMRQLAGATGDPSSADRAVRAAAAARRLDDAFRTYLAERGHKPVQLAEVVRLVTGVAAIRLAADAVVDLWQRDGGEPRGDGEAASREILATTQRLQGWYDDLAFNLARRNDLSEPQDHDKAADARLINAVRHDLVADDAMASATAVRMIWTADHLDAVRRLQQIIVPAASAAIARDHEPVITSRS